MKVLYFMRVLFISFEFILILFSIGVLMIFPLEVNSIASKVYFNVDLIKWMIFLPVTLFGWCVKEGRDLVVDNQERGRVLVNWPDYWRLKTHVVVALFFSLFFVIFAAIPWLGGIGIGTGEGFLIFVASCFGSFVVAGHLYFAKISMNEVFLVD